mgnify:CR=1 FL=1
MESNGTATTNQAYRIGQFPGKCRHAGTRPRPRGIFLQLGTDIETDRQTLDNVLAQTDMRQQATSERHRDLTNLIKEAKQVGTSVQRDTAITQDLITVEKSETTKLRQAIRDSTTAPQDIEDTTRTAVRKTVQNVIDSEMSKIERGMHGTLLTKGETFAAQAKREMSALVSETKTIMTDDLEHHCRKLSSMLSKQANDTHNEASSLLDQTVMLLGEEMEIAHTEFYARLSDQNVKKRQIDSIQKRVLNAMRPQIDELQANLIKEVNAEIGEAFQNAQDDLHLQQGMLTKTTDEKLQAHNQNMDAKRSRPTSRPPQKSRAHRPRNSRSTTERKERHTIRNAGTKHTRNDERVGQTKPSEQQPAPSTKPSQPTSFRHYTKRGRMESNGEQMQGKS